MEADKRYHQVKIRLNDGEYLRLKNRIRHSGQTQQSYLLCAIEDVKSTSSKEVTQLKIANEHLKVISVNIRAIGNNVNQIAKHANKCNAITSEEMDMIQQHIRELNKEVNRVWRYSRLVLVRLLGKRRLDQ